MIGKTILNYKILSLIGSGGMGSVYLAQHAHVERYVAIKVLLPQFLDNQEIKLRFKNEASTLAHLQHPSIVSLYDYLEDETGLYLVMEFVEGETLEDYIDKKTGPIPEEIAVPIMIEILSAFSYAHKKGIVHRDIKPANILLAEGMTVKILDFGIAKFIGEARSRLTKTGAPIGTVYYMSPEQVRSYELDLRSDIYSLGVTFYQMVTGTCPYADLTSEFDVFNKIVGEDLPDPKATYPLISEHVCQVIRKATAKQIENRFQNSDEFIQALKNKVYSYKESEITQSNRIIKSPPKREVFLKPAVVWRSLFLILLLIVLVKIFVIPHYMNSSKVSAEDDRLKSQKKTVKLLLKGFVKVKGGTYVMGLDGFRDDEKKHTVQLSTFYVQPNEVTQELYEEVIGFNPSDDQSNKLLPVTNVSWVECQVFIRKLNALTGKNYRLPTEAEWEYAARGGRKSKGYLYSGSNAIGDVSWYEENSGNTSHKVKTRLPNELGLFDMSGNVWEWCSDYYGQYNENDMDNPKGPLKATYRVIRGGGFYRGAERCRNGRRDYSQPGIGQKVIGFRLVYSN